jgi:hypothetical protein
VIILLLNALVIQFNFYSPSSDEFEFWGEVESTIIQILLGFNGALSLFKMIQGVYDKVKGKIESTTGSLKQ